MGKEFKLVGNLFHLYEDGKEVSDFKPCNEIQVLCLKSPDGFISVYKYGSPSDIESILSRLSIFFSSAGEADAFENDRRRERLRGVLGEPILFSTKADRISEIELNKIISSVGAIGDFLARSRGQNRAP